MFKIGDVVIGGKVVIAPMAGVTSFAFRKYFSQFGANLTYTEMISDCGIVYGNKESRDYFPKNDDPRPIAFQLFGGQTETLVKALKIIQEDQTVDYDILDLNLGCPVPKVTRGNGGSSWLKDLDKLSLMIKEVVSASNKPVTVKIRLGWDDEHINFKEAIKVLEEAGVSAIGLHLRTTKQMYTGKARYELVKDLRKEMSVPLLISGDIFTLDDAINALDTTGADAVMVARGGRGNPFLIKQISHYYQYGERLSNRTLGQQGNYLLEFARELIKEKGETTAVSNLRGLATHFINGYDDIKDIKRAISNLQSYEHLIQLIEPILNSTLEKTK